MVSPQVLVLIPVAESDEDWDPVVICVVGEDLECSGEFVSQCFDLFSLLEKSDFTGRNLAVQPGMFSTRWISVEEPGKGFLSACNLALSLIGAVVYGQVPLERRRKPNTGS